MADGGARRRRVVSPYSRTGLFPWGNTYDVPAQLDGDRFSSQTPCHLRTVTMPSAATIDDETDVACPACGRRWLVRYRRGTTPPVARWTA
ncbi:hypothetical protein BH23ACT10_BH23ACT10_01420 [soil metagenome]